MTGRCGTDGCFYSLFPSQKSPRTQIRAGMSLRCRGRTWGNLPIEAEEASFPGGGSAIPGKGRREQGRRGLKDRWGWSGERSEAGARSKRPGRPKTGMAGCGARIVRTAPCCPCKKGDSVQAAGREHGLPVAPGRGPLHGHRMALAGRRANESPRRAGALRSEDGGRDTAAAIT